MYTTLGAPAGAWGGSNGVQSGSESRMSTLMVPLNGFAIKTPRLSSPSPRAEGEPHLWLPFYYAAMSPAAGDGCASAASPVIASRSRGQPTRSGTGRRPVPDLSTLLLVRRRSCVAAAGGE